MIKALAPSHPSSRANQANTAFTSANIETAQISYLGDVGRIACSLNLQGEFGSVHNIIQRDPFLHYVVFTPPGENSRRLSDAEHSDLLGGLNAAAAKLPEPTKARRAHGTQETAEARAWALRYLARIVKTSGTHPS